MYVVTTADTVRNEREGNAWPGKGMQKSNEGRKQSWYYAYSLNVSSTWWSFEKWLFQSYQVFCISTILSIDLKRIKKSL